MQFDPIAYINEPRWQQARLGLDRTRELLDRMGRPQDRLKFVHVAGTNGKGSICAYTESILRTAGYKTGLFTSPYILQFEERIRVNGENISQDDLRDVTLFVKGHAEAMAEKIGEHPTEFELMTAVAFEYFARSECDIVVCEVGLGGRLDSTNIIESPEVCVIARIGLDHTDFLGTTIAEIAHEKAGIIKPGVPVVSWPQESDDARNAIEEVAARQNATMSMPDFSDLAVGAVQDGVRAFSYKGVSYSTKLLGSYQPYNAVLALEAASALKSKGWRIDEGVCQAGVSSTVWPGRFEIVSSGKPVIIVDGGHNPQGARVLADSLKDVFPGKRIVFLMSVLADKDYRKMISEVLSLAEAFVCVTPPNPRALAAHDLQATIREMVLETGSADSIEVFEEADFAAAIARAKGLSGEQGIVCAFGSLYSIAELRAALDGE